MCSAMRICKSDHYTGPWSQFPPVQGPFWLYPILVTPGVQSGDLLKLVHLTGPDPGWLLKYV